jgi:Ca2+-binding EF-hand superfamily protein
MKRNIDDHISDESINQAFHEFDTKKDGKVFFQQFSDVINSRKGAVNSSQ